ncbi:unnamed protein product, partial [Iphiclides podalirius]
MTHGYDTSRDRPGLSESIQKQERIGETFATRQEVLNDVAPASRLSRDGGWERAASDEAATALSLYYLIACQREEHWQRERQMTIKIAAELLTGRVESLASNVAWSFVLDIYKSVSEVGPARGCRGPPLARLIAKYPLAAVAWMCLVNYLATAPRILGHRIQERPPRAVAISILRLTD